MFRHLRFFLFFLMALTSSAASRADSLIEAGAACDSLGITTMASNQQSIVACLKDASGNLFWKSMTDSAGGVPKGTIAFFALATCPSGWAMSNGANGTVDLRGEFLRVWDAGRGVDAGRALGSTQADELKSHSHNLTVAPHQDGADNGFTLGYRSVINTSNTALLWPYGGAETRPRNIALLSCQKL